MAAVDPAGLDLDALFTDEGMFDSRRAWSAAGFRLLDRSDGGKIMVASHPSAQGLLFKKYANDTSASDQAANYERRLEGAARLRAFVAERKLRRIAVPSKRIVKLPPRSFSRRARLLVVERLDVVGAEQTKASYRSIDEPLLRELCVVLFHFRGMDSIAKNLPFVADGRIALIDTEHWDRPTDKPYLHRVGDYLPDELRRRAKRIFRRLEDGEE